MVKEKRGIQQGGGASKKPRAVRARKAQGGGGKGEALQVSEPAGCSSSADVCFEADEFWSRWIQDPPPSLRQDGYERVQPPAEWATKHGAKLASSCKPVMGTVSLTFVVVSPNVAELIDALTSDVAETRPEDAKSGCVTWNEEGESRSRGCFTVSSLAQACERGDLRAEDDKVARALSAMQDLMKSSSESLPWMPQPLLRVVAPRAAGRVLKQVLTVNMWVYLRRMLFYLIAYPPIHDLMLCLQPVGAVRPLAKVERLEEPVFFSCAEEKKNKSEFTLRGIMKLQEHGGYASAKQPEGLRLQLLDYQLQTLQWMIDHEEIEFGLNQLFWQRREFLDGAWRAKAGGASCAPWRDFIGGDGTGKDSGDGGADSDAEAEEGEREEGREGEERASRRLDGR
eukprot:372669-Hanusia_phi.AAC.2